MTHQDSQPSDGDARDHPANESPAEVHDLVEDIDQTRAEMSATVGEISDRLKPEHVAATAKANVRQATINRVKDAADAARQRGAQVVGTVRENPIAAATITVAASALALLAAVLTRRR